MTSRALAFDVRPNARTLNPLVVDSADIREWIERRDPIASGHWRELGAAEHGRAFTAARTAGHDVIDDLYFAFADTIERGGTEVDFARLVTPTLKAKGWLEGDEGRIAYRVQLIYDTNLRLARASGRWARYQRTRAAFPYLRAATARDDRVRRPPRSKHADHTAWDGIILPADHPFWTRWFPPLGFRCRCTVIQMTRSQLARFKGGVTSENELAEREARLGVPVFAAPGGGLAEQLADMVKATNAGPIMPGMPGVDPAETARQGAALFDSLLAQEASDNIEEFLKALFG